MRTIGALCTLCLALAITACGGGATDSPSSTRSRQAPSSGTPHKGDSRRAGGDQGAVQGRSDEAEVKSTLAAYFRALADGDGPKACALLTAKQQRLVTEEVSMRIRGAS